MPSAYRTTHFKREIQFHVIRPITSCLVVSVMMRFTTNLYCDILGYDIMKFDMYIETLLWKTFPQNYGQNREVKYTFPRSYFY